MSGLSMAVSSAAASASGFSGAAAGLAASNVSDARSGSIDIASIILELTEQSFVCGTRSTCSVPARARGRASGARAACARAVGGSEGVGGVQREVRGGQQRRLAGALARFKLISAKTFSVDHNLPLRLLHISRSRCL